jgi:hypothetical protein
MAIHEGLSFHNEARYYKELHELKKMSQSELYNRCEFLLWRSLLLTQRIAEINEEMDKRIKELEQMTEETHSKI